MTARQVIIPDATPSRDANGRALPAKLRFYLPDTTTPTTVYADELLSVPLAWPVLSDSAGRFPTIWADDSKSFDVGYSDIASDTTLATYEDVQPLQGAVLASGAAAQAAADSAQASAAAAAASAAAAQQVYTDTVDYIEPLGSLAAAVALAQTAATSSNASAIAADVSADAAELAAQSAQNIGRHSLWLKAEGFLSQNSNPATINATETSTNKVNFRTFDFATAVDTFIQIDMALPKSWDRGDVTYAVYWLHNTNNASAKVAWSLAGLSIGNDEAIDAAFGTPQFSNDIGGTASHLYISPESPLLTIGSSPSIGDLTFLKFGRHGASNSSNDNLPENARALGIMFFLNTNQGNDA